MTAIDTSVVGANPATTDLTVKRGQVLRTVLRSPLALISLLWLIVVTVASAGASWLAPYSATDTDLLNRLAGPSVAHKLGTDQLGRDVLSRLMFGGGDALLGVVEATAVYVILGVTLGVLAGYFGGLLDWFVTRWAEITVALPAILFLLVVLAVFPRNEHAAMVAFGVLAAPGLARVMRAETLRIREELYIAAARVAGLGDWKILRLHVVTRLGTTIIVQGALLASVSLVVQAGLSFLGLGVQDPSPSWGGMVNAASQSLDRDKWLLIPTGGIIAITVMALGLIGDTLRDATAAQWARTAVTRKSNRATKDDPASLDDAAPADSTTGQHLLSVRSLRVTFGAGPGATTVVQNVSFTLNRGETLGIIGESGSGKSVTVSAILGLLPASAAVAAASCDFDGQELLALNAADRHALRGRRIGYVSQEPLTALDPTTQIGRLLAEAVRHHQKGTRQAAKDRAVELLRLVNLPNPEQVARRYPHQISGGMAQRVAIALALAGDPELLVADEPTTALDVTVQAEILALLQRLQREMGLAVVLITHDWGVVAQLCSRALVMYAGQIVEQGTVQDLYHRPAHPYTVGLMAANPHHALKLAGQHGNGQLLELPTIAGTVPAPRDWPRSCHFQDRCPMVTPACRDAPIPLIEVAAQHASRCIHIDEVTHRRELT